MEVEGLVDHASDEKKHTTDVLKEKAYDRKLILKHPREMGYFKEFDITDTYYAQRDNCLTCKKGLRCALHPIEHK